MSNEQIQLLQQIVDILESKDNSALKSLLVDQRSSDIAEVVEIVENDEKRIIFDFLFRKNRLCNN